MVWVCDKYEVWSPVVVEAGRKQVEVTFPDNDLLKDTVSRSLIKDLIFVPIPIQKVLNSLRGMQRTALGMGHYSACFYTPHICFFPNLLFQVKTETEKTSTDDTDQCMRRTDVNRKRLVKGRSKHGIN